MNRLDEINDQMKKLQEEKNKIEEVVLKEAKKDFEKKYVDKYYKMKNSYGPRVGKPWLKYVRIVGIDNPYFSGIEILTTVFMERFEMDCYGSLTYKRKDSCYLHMLQDNESQIITLEEFNAEKQKMVDYISRGGK